MSDTPGLWQAHGERAIYDSPWVWLGQVDVEHYVYTGRDPRRVGEPTDLTEAARVEWVPLASVPALIAAGEIWSAGSVAALPLLLMRGRP
jgi:hypothetical protein